MDPAETYKGSQGAGWQSMDRTTRPKRVSRVLWVGVNSRGL